MSSKNLIISPNQPWLAPLAGYTDLPFRMLCRHFGCTIACTEMVSAKGLVYKSPGTAELLRTNKQDIPLVVQLFGSEPKFIALAMDLLLEQGFTYFDLNCGCPVKKVTKTGSGSALLKNPDLIQELIAIMVAKAGKSKVGAKIRLGWNSESLNYIEIGRSLEQTGLAWICLHPRTGVQGFTGQAKWEHLAKLKQALNIPVIGSGDIITAQDGLNCLQQTGIDAVMFARGALQDPAIFTKFQSLMIGQTQPINTLEQIKNIVSSLEEFYTEYGHPRQALLKMRTLVPRFMKGMAGAREIRKNICTCKNWQDLHNLLAQAEVEYQQQL